MFSYISHFHPTTSPHKSWRLRTKKFFLYLALTFATLTQHSAEPHHNSLSSERALSSAYQPSRSNRAWPWKWKLFKPYDDSADGFALWNNEEEDEGKVSVPLREREWRSWFEWWQKLNVKERKTKMRNFLRRVTKEMRNESDCETCGTRRKLLKVNRGLSNFKVSK